MCGSSATICSESMPSLAGLQYTKSKIQPQIALGCFTGIIFLLLIVLVLLAFWSCA